VPPAALAFWIVRSWIATVTGTCVAVPGVHPPMNRPRNWLLPLSVLLLPMMVTLVCTAGRSAVSVMFDVKVMVSPLPALVMALRNCASVPTWKSVANAGPAASAASTTALASALPASNARRRAGKGCRYMT
jgi:hypothetical protein